MCASAARAPLAGGCELGARLIEARRAASSAVRAAVRLDPRDPRARRRAGAASSSTRSRVWPACSMAWRSAVDGACCAANTSPRAASTSRSRPSIATRRAARATAVAAASASAARSRARPPRRRLPPLRQLALGRLAPGLERLELGRDVARSLASKLLDLLAIERDLLLPAIDVQSRSACAALARRRRARSASTSSIRTPRPGRARAR